jgi:hypothetical protein
MVSLNKMSYGSDFFFKKSTYHNTHNEKSKRRGLKDHHKLAGIPLDQQIGSDMTRTHSVGVNHFPEQAS